MQTDDLARWVNEIYGELMDLKNKLFGGSVFDPDKYEYITPFLDLSSIQSVAILNHEGQYLHTAEEPVAVVLSITSHSDLCNIFIQDDSTPANDLRVARMPGVDTPYVVGPYYLEAGQSIRIDTEGTITNSMIYIAPLEKSHLQEHEIQT